MDGETTGVRTVVEKGVESVDKPSSKTDSTQTNTFEETLREGDVIRLQLLRHQMENPFKCAICDAVFSTADALSNHIGSHSLDVVQISKRLKIKSSQKRKMTDEVEAEDDDCADDFTVDEGNDDHHVDEEKITEKRKMERKTRKRNVVSSRLSNNIISRKPKVVYEEVSPTSESNTDCELSHESRLEPVEIMEKDGFIKFLCSKCPRLLKSEYHYKMHVRSCDGSGVLKKKTKSPGQRNQTQQCDVCQKICMSEYHLRLHKQKHAIKGPKSQPKLLSCPECDKTFINQNTLKTHRNYVHNSEKRFSCNVCEKSFVRKASLVLHSAIHSDVQPYACDLCPARFKRKDAILTHKKRKHKESVETIRKKRFFCKICGTYFHDRTHYKRVHQEGNEPKSKKVMCELCGNWYSTNGSLRDHVKTVHEGIRDFECSDCGRKFTQRGALNVHKTIHSQERAFLCDICGKAFRTKKVMERHKGSHSSIRPYRCESCGKDFPRSEHLKRHMKIHVPNRGAPERKFVCEVCNRMFTCRRYLRDHETTHYREGDRPYKCDICGLRYGQDYDLQRHLLEHDGHRDILCKDCGKNFKSSDQYHYHIRTNHGREPDPHIIFLMESRKKYLENEVSDNDPNVNTIIDNNAGGTHPDPQNTNVGFASSSDKSYPIPVSTSNEKQFPAEMTSHVAFSSEQTVGMAVPRLPQVSMAHNNLAAPVAQVYPGNYTWTMPSYRF